MRSYASYLSAPQEIKHKEGAAFIAFLEGMCELQPLSALVVMTFYADELEDLALVPVRAVAGEEKIDCLLLGLIFFSFSRARLRSAGRIEESLRRSDPMFRYEILRQRPIVVQSTELAAEFLRREKPWWAFWKRF